MLAADPQSTANYQDSVFVKIQDSLEYFFAFTPGRKVKVLEKQAERKLTKAQSFAEDNGKQEVQNLLQNYLQIKDKQTNMLGKTDDAAILNTVAEKTVEQQKTMEEIKAVSDEDTKKQVVQAQEQVVNQVAQRVVETNGEEGQTEFFEKVEHVWAPGTGPGGREAGVVIEGGVMQFAPGTSSGGPSGVDIKTVEIKTGGGENNVIETEN